MKPLLAHLGDHEPQLLEHHLFGVAEETRRAAEKIGLPLAGELIGLLHDLGKASDEFQAYLRSFDPALGLAPRHDLRGKVDHSTAGAQRIANLLADGAGARQLHAMVAHLMGLCVVSHHGGLLDCLKPDGREGLDHRLGYDEHQTHAEEAWENIAPEVRARAETLARDPALLAEWNRKLTLLLKGKRTSGDREVQLGLFVRMLFSCLIDADRTDTADYENRGAARHRQRGAYDSWEVLLARFDGEFAKLPATGAVNDVRRRISEECFAAALRPSGIYTLTVPTGGGKTLAALRFALEHARLKDSPRQPGIDRVVFVSPYISIVDQNAAVARGYLEPEGTDYGTVVLEHHSDVARERDVAGEPDVDGWRRRVLAENWDAPIVFTTMAQVLEAMFGAGTRSVRRLHALSRAVLIFDEVQTLPIKLVHLFNNAINLLAAHCGSTVVLCTATQPLLQQVDKSYGAAALSPSPDLIADVGEVFSLLHRYTVHDRTGEPGGWTHARAAALVCDEARAHGGCLLVVNTKRDALETFKLCREIVQDSQVKARVVHLSTGMCPVHRTEALAKLKAWLKEPEPGPPIVCVSTQLIEAGVDIDFPCVVRDLAGLDSIAQAAGRCNRHGTRAEPGRVHIVDLPEPSEKLHDIRKGRKVAREQLGRWRREHPGEPFPLDRPEQMKQYYEASFYQRRAEMVFPVKAKEVSGLNRDSNLLDLLGGNAMAAADAERTGTSPGRDYLLQSFKTANNAFKLIESTQGIVVPFRESGAEVVNDLSAAHDLAVEWKTLRRAQPYTINVFEWQFQRLLADGAIYAVNSGMGVYCLRAEFYDEHFGLSNVASLMETQIG